ncbi:MAG: pyruvate kinase [Akkermansiaceae bacterium]|jgi:pyruvate kinase|nr:pyruvate kinase [Akkermansiaceae bacterium]MDP4647913.1 pyruvate kinase [Akkermansiaceae bacterium]MDP4719702.1 pyruvate kinase [Akkermansiaceae bacterium]MDP4781257.1 pyruvate kinase [Akkermansiaceae bacterium]MDP4846013.1 pyruvate kinase [Akkermansiaceae bacterium]
MSRKTKLIVTLGPATEKAETIGELIDGGVNVFRLNMSHAKHEWAALMTKHVRQESSKRGLHIAVLFDLTGPSIRTGDVVKNYELKEGDKVEFRKEGTEPTIPISTTVNYPGMMQDVSEGNILVVDNGALLMHIDRTADDRIICDVRTPGTMGSRRHINLPGVRLNLPALTEKDHKDLALAVECGADYIAGSFVRDAAHVRELREAMEALEGEAQIVAKIEDQEAVRNIDAIIQSADVIMIARGDLGIEVDFEDLPILQRRIVKRCHELGTRVIVATQLLESMITNPTPTRAEVTDVMNAAYEEADALMLSGETSVGRYPLRCVDALVRISARIERSGGHGFGAAVILRDERQKTARAAVTLADSLPDARLVVLTRRGVLANHIALMRPRTGSFFAFTPKDGVCRKLSLTRGIRAFQMGFSSNIEETIGRATEQLRAENLVRPGTPIVIVSDILSDHFAANSILLHHA